MPFTDTTKLVEVVIATDTTLDATNLVVSVNGIY